LTARLGRAFQDAKRQAARHGEAEITEQIAIDVLGKFPGDHGLRKT
jgi:hypothetical protein